MASSASHLESLESRLLLAHAWGGFLPEQDYSVGDQPAGIVAGDFDGKSGLDLAVANQGSDTVSILLNNGNGTFQLARNYSVGANPWNVVVADFNGDHFLDLAVSHAGGDFISILWGKGDGTFKPRDPKQDLLVGGNAYGLAAADFNGDTNMDLAATSRDNNTVSVLLGKGDGAFQAPRIFATAANPIVVVAADLDGDGKPDLVTGSDGPGEVSVLLNHGDGTFPSHVDYNAGYTESVFVGDVNADGKADVLGAPYNGGDLTVLLGDGKGAFTSKPGVATGATHLTLDAADFNGDGKPDLVTASPPNSLGILLGIGDGTFQARQDHAISGGVSQVLARDVNGDGLQDIVATTSVGTVSVLINKGTNNPPVAAADRFTFDPKNPLLNVLANDSDADGDPLSLLYPAGVVPTVHGTISPSGGKVQYTPTAGYAGPDDFTYTVKDGFGGTATATVTIDVPFSTTIGGENQPSKATFTDADGTAVSVTLTGGGTAELAWAGVVAGPDGKYFLSPPALTAKGSTVQVNSPAGRAALMTVTLNGTGAKSTLTVTTNGRGDGLTTIQRITGSAMLGTLSAPKVDLTTAGIVMADQGYIASVRVHDILSGAGITMPGEGVVTGTQITAALIQANTQITLGANLNLTRLTASQWNGGSLTAPSAGVITITGDKKRAFTGDLKAALTLGKDSKGNSLGSLNVAGWLDSAAILSQGNMGAITSGGVKNSRIFASVLNAATLTGLPDPIRGFADPGVGTPAKIASLTIKGTVKQTVGTASVSTVNLLLAAPAVGPVNLFAPSLANGGNKWGLSTQQKKIRLRVNFYDTLTIAATTTNPNATSVQVLDGWAWAKHPVNVGDLEVLTPLAK